MKNYLENGFQSKHKWLYLVFPLAFLGLNVMSASENTEALIELQKLGELPSLITLLFPFLLFIGFLFLMVTYVHKQNITLFTTGRNKIDKKRILFSFTIWGLFSIGITAVQYALFPQDFQWNFQPIPFLKLTAICLILIPFQTSFEEYFFRAYLMQGVGYFTKTKWIPFLVSSLIFGLAHFANPEIKQFGWGFMGLYLISGFFLGIITIFDNGLELSLGVHAANNIFSALLVTSNFTIFQTPSLFKQIGTPTLSAIDFLLIIIPYSILFFIFAKKYNWTFLKNT